jgi:alpha/beta superfamily hydrolase
MTQTAGKDSAWATRVDGASTVEVGFFGSSGCQLFGRLHSPSNLAPTAGVIVCSPLHAEFAKNYGNEVILGQRLSHQGVSVLRFDYRGQGHSDGQSSEITLKSMVEDALHALEHMQSRTGVSHVGIVGCRLGGFVAACAASLWERAPLVLWEPILRPDTYVRDAIRSRVISSLSSTAADKLSAEVLRTYLNERGSVDVHGYPIHRNLVRSLQDRSLEDELGSSPRAIHVIQISKSQKVRSDLAAVIDEWSELGFAADVRCVTGELSWWFRGSHQSREEPEALANELAADTASWITSYLDERNPV